MKLFKIMTLLSAAIRIRSCGCRWCQTVELLICESRRNYTYRELYRFAAEISLVGGFGSVPLKGKGTDDLFVRMVDKLLLNSLYGKFAELEG